MAKRGKKDHVGGASIYRPKPTNQPTNQRKKVCDCESEEYVNCVREKLNKSKRAFAFWTK